MAVDLTAGPDSGVRYSPAVSWRFAEHRSVQESVAQQRAPIDLGKCLETFCATERLNAFCSRCTKDKGEYVETMQQKTLSLWATPPVLIVQLKRFKRTPRTSYKLQTAVTFPLEGLNLLPYLAEEQHAEKRPKVVPRDAPETPDAPVTPVPPDHSSSEDAVSVATEAPERTDPAGSAQQSGRDKSAAEELPRVAPEDIPLTTSRNNVAYDLYAVVNHVGIMGAGHYFAYIRKGDQWYNFNDRRVMPISPEEVVSRAAYLLFYRRRDIGGLVDSEVPDLFERVFPSGPSPAGAAGTGLASGAGLAERPVGVVRGRSGHLGASYGTDTDVIYDSTAAHTDGAASEHSGTHEVNVPYPWTLHTEPVDQEEVARQNYSGSGGRRNYQDWWLSQQCSIS